MAMEGKKLGAEMFAKIQEVIDEIANNPTGHPMTLDQKQRLNSVAGEAIVNHIRDNAEIITPTGPGRIM